MELDKEVKSLLDKWMSETQDSKDYQIIQTIISEHELPPINYRYKFTIAVRNRKSIDVYLIRVDEYSDEALNLVQEKKLNLKPTG